MTTLTIRIDDELDKLLAEMARRQHRSKSDLVRDMLRRQSRLELFREARRVIAPKARAAGYLTDEDVFRDIS
ncbi:MAG TPA: ribbon-helix-helix protein, CopG family [Gammaproteobacteria bacterium]|nr:ribbon-helix-helix protein, CopG family [Gammaproteobacteria bacterium]